MTGVPDGTAAVTLEALASDVVFVYLAEETLGDLADKSPFRRLGRRLGLHAEVHWTVKEQGRSGEEASDATRQRALRVPPELLVGEAPDRVPGVVARLRRLVRFAQHGLDAAPVLVVVRATEPIVEGCAGAPFARYGLDAVPVPVPVPAPNAELAAHGRVPLARDGLDEREPYGGEGRLVGHVATGAVLREAEESGGRRPAGDREGVRAGVAANAPARLRADDVVKPDDVRDVPRAHGPLVPRRPRRGRAGLGHRLDGSLRRDARVVPDRLRGQHPDAHVVETLEAEYPLLGQGGDRDGMRGTGAVASGPTTNPRRVCRGRAALGEEELHHVRQGVRDDASIRGEEVDRAHAVLEETTEQRPAAGGSGPPPSSGGAGLALKLIFLDLASADRPTGPLVGWRVCVRERERERETRV
ncbi:hypothetical protein THAOC_32388 [Thalassiosira oceanica]|uniref:Uncharacterized protein n=1 Tax=Thalassiosira oceanica TaxID=159749 RepID=K0R9B7_THAOC|nr:hypothetical protein THAOC_32388 [Thalassiosira oceanica]|eukprot:EJK48784.1 hypothetical protein THAOC_32388 [Thalassiosira oceanica]